MGQFNFQKTASVRFGQIGAALAARLHGPKGSIALADGTAIDVAANGTRVELSIDAIHLDPKHDLTLTLKRSEARALAARLIAAADAARRSAK